MTIKGTMKVAVFGAGHIGETLATRFAATGHDVRLANSRPHTIEHLAPAVGATAMRSAAASTTWLGTSSS